MTVSVPATGVSSTVANVLPSVSTILPTKPTCSVNDALTSVLYCVLPGLSLLALRFLLKLPILFPSLVVLLLALLSLLAAIVSLKEVRQIPPARGKRVGEVCFWRHVYVI